MADGTSWDSDSPAGFDDHRAPIFGQVSFGTFATDLLGLFGVHRFYLGRTGSGIIMLVLSITVIGLIISAPWALIDMIRYLMMSNEEFAARYPRKR